MSLLNLFGNVSLDSTVNEIKNLIQTLLKPLTQVTGSGSNRLSVDINNVVGGTITTVTTCSTVTTCNTVSAVTNQVNMGGVSAFELQKAMSHDAYANSIRPQLA